MLDSVKFLNPRKWLNIISFVCKNIILSFFGGGQILNSLSYFGTAELALAGLFFCKTEDKGTLVLKETFYSWHKSLPFDGLNSLLYEHLEKSYETFERIMPCMMQHAL